MRPFYIIALGAAVIAASVAPGFAQVRVDTNGEMVNANTTPGSVTTAFVPYNWTSYSTGAGGGVGSKYDTGGSSNSQNINTEAEPFYAGAAYPGGSWPATAVGGHSLIFGGVGAAVSSTYGVYQNITTTAGKAYFLVGAEGANADWSAAVIANYNLNFGITNGANNPAGGVTAGGNIRSNPFSAATAGGRFISGMIATGSSATVFVGMKTNGTSNTGINAYIDGLRVYEVDIPVYGWLYNSSFELSGAINVSNYNAGVAGPTYDSQSWLVPGWINLGGGAGQSEAIYTDSIASSGVKALYQQQWKGSGRTYNAQRVNAGDGNYTFSADVRTDSATDSGAKIGIDPTGGLDPNAGTVIWSTAAATAGSYVNLSVNATVTGGNGATLFLGSGLAQTTWSTRSGGNSGARFDNLNLVVPEPGSILALGAGLIGFAGAFRRKA